MHRNNSYFECPSFCVTLLRVLPNMSFAFRFYIIFLLFWKVYHFTFPSSFLFSPTFLYFRKPEFSPHLRHLLAMCLDCSHFATMSLSFLICAMGWKPLPSLPSRDTERTNWEDGYDQLTTIKPTNIRPALIFITSSQQQLVLNAQPSPPVLAHPRELDAACT